MHEQTLHYLKTFIEYFSAIWSGAKTFEIRKDPTKKFKLNDFLVLQEWDKKSKKYTGRSLIVKIVYILHGGQFGISKKYSVLGIRVAKKNKTC